LTNIVHKGGKKLHTGQGRYLKTATNSQKSMTIVIVRPKDMTTVIVKLKDMMIVIVQRKDMTIAIDQQRSTTIVIDKARVPGEVTNQGMITAKVDTVVTVTEAKRKEKMSTAKRNGTQRKEETMIA